MRRVSRPAIAPSMDAMRRDPYWKKVTLLLLFENIDGATTFYDLSPQRHAATVGGDAQLSTAQPKWGASSLLLDGTGDYLSFPGQAFAGDFTVESWNMRTNTGQRALFTLGNESSGRHAIYQASGTSIVTVDKFGIGTMRAGSATSSTAFQHTMLARRGTQMLLFQDWVQQGSAWTDNSTIGNTNALRIGCNGAANNDYWQGYVGAFRVTVDAFRPDGSIPPEVFPFPTRG